MRHSLLRLVSQLQFLLDMRFRFVLVQDLALRQV
nr:MAG TPA: hypothetical protein [Caudoviricetes sp.]